MTPYPLPSQPPTHLDANTSANAIARASVSSASHPAPLSEAPEQETHQLFNQMIEYAPVGMFVLNVETQRIRVGNRVVRDLYEHYTGRPASDLYGDQSTILLPWFARHGLLDQLQQVALSGTPLLAQTLELNDSTGTPAMWWSYDIVPLGETEQPVTEVLVTLRDRTAQVRERKRAEAAIFSAQLRTELFETIIEQIAEAVIVRDRAGKLVVYNREALSFARNRSAVERGRAHGVRVTPEWDMLNEDGKPLPRPELPEWRVMLTGAPLFNDDLLVRRENGQMMPVLVHATPLRDEVGAISGAVIAFQDISVVKEEERLKDEMTTVAGHELRQPITIIQGQAQMLKRHLLRLAGSENLPINPETLNKLADSVESQTTRLNMLVSDLLDMSRIQAGQLQLNSARMALVPLVTRLVELQREATNDHQIVLDDTVPSSYGNLEGLWDASRVEQILANLLNNAVKYSPAGGEIRVTLGVLSRGTNIGIRERGRGRRRLPADFAHVAIKDEGIGIPADALQHVFERFYRARNTGGIQGTGLGLYICQQLALAHQGALWVESRGISHGSTFHLALPLG